MASLTTTYIVCTVLASAGAMTAAYVANRITSKEESPKESVPPPPKEEEESPKEESVPPSAEIDADDEKSAELENLIEKELADLIRGGGNHTVADLMTEIIKNDEYVYEDDDVDEIGLKFKKIWSGIGNKCPPKLIEVCKIIAQKAKNIKAILVNKMNKNSYPPIPEIEVTPLGDQRDAMIELLSQSDNQ